VITIVASGDDLPPVNIATLIQAGVRDLVGGFQASGGLFHTTEVKNKRWLEVARLINWLEVVFGESFIESRQLLDQIRSDPWCQITVDWDDLDG